MYTLPRLLRCSVRSHVAQSQGQPPATAKCTRRRRGRNRKRENDNNERTNSCAWETENIVSRRESPNESRERRRSAWKVRRALPIGCGLERFPARTEKFSQHGGACVARTPSPIIRFNIDAYSFSFLHCGALRRGDRCLRSRFVLQLFRIVCGEIVVDRFSTFTGRACALNERMWGTDDGGGGQTEKGTWMCKSHSVSLRTSVSPHWIRSSEWCARESSSYLIIIYLRISDAERMNSGAGRKRSEWIKQNGWNSTRKRGGDGFWVRMCLI